MSRNFKFESLTKRESKPNLRLRPTLGWVKIKMVLQLVPSLKGGDYWQQTMYTYNSKHSLNLTLLLKLLYICYISYFSLHIFPATIVDLILQLSMLIFQPQHIVASQVVCQITRKTGSIPSLPLDRWWHPHTGPFRTVSTSVAFHNSEVNPISDTEC